MARSKNKMTSLYRATHENLAQTSVSRNTFQPHKSLPVPAMYAGIRNHKPRNAWHQRGWSNISPYYMNVTTIDSRWDKS